MLHAGALYKFNQSSGSADTAFQATIGGDFAGVSADAYYSKVNSAITASSLSAAQVAGLPALGYSPSNSLAGTISDNTTYALMASYKLEAIKFSAGYEHIRYANPTTPLNAGYTNIGGYVLAFVTNTAYVNAKTQQVYWAGARYSFNPHLDLTAAYYNVNQDAYGTGTQAGCSTAAHSSCSGSLEAVSLDADYRFNVHFDAYLGAMYSEVHNGLASSYLYTNNSTRPLAFDTNFEVVRSAHGPAMARTLVAYTCSTQHEAA